MFRKYYKAANDDISPNRELIDAIFEKAEKQNTKPSKVYKFGRSYGVMVAAALVLAATAVVYPWLNKTNETPSVQPKTNSVGIENSENKNFSSTEYVYAENKKESKASAKAADTSSETENTNSRIAVASEQNDEQGFLIPENAEKSVQARTIENLNVCKIASEDITDVNEAEIARITEFLKSRFGEKDTQMGHEYIFEIAGKAEDFYIGRWKWFVNDHSSLLTEFVLNFEMTEMYEFQYTENETIQWNTENNLLK
ncbi:MAG: hypothetical protein IKW64_03300 [Clostridia bacterium]|nr:hypothetical protein [Clostridia bacterium]